jgi:hypothetical protein
MLRSRIVRGSLQRAERSLTGHPALQLRLHFLRGALFEWVGAAAQDEPSDCKGDCEGLHLLILGTKPLIANKLIL